MWVDEYLSEVAGLAGKARALIAANPRRRFVCGPCTEADCIGTLSASVGPKDDLLPPYLECDVDPEHRWTSAQFPRLERLMNGGAIHPDGAALFLARLKGTA
jgi:hypothetical protein